MRVLKDYAGNISKELWNLAVRHKEILEHKFPKFRYFLSGSNVSEKIILHVDIVYDNDGADDDSRTVTAILGVIFSSDSLIVTEPKKPSDGTFDFSSSFAVSLIYYADPGFTDDFLSDKLEELVLKMRLNGEMAIDLGGT